MKLLTNILAITSAILYVFSYNICEYYYPLEEQLPQWNTLKDLLRGIGVFTLVILNLNLTPKTIFLKACMVTLCYYCIANLVDRLWFNVTVFVDSDYAVHLISIIAGIITYKYVKRRSLD